MEECMDFYTLEVVYHRLVNLAESMPRGSAQRSEVFGIADDVFAKMAAIQEAASKPVVENGPECIDKARAIVHSAKSNFALHLIPARNQRTGEPASILCASGANGEFEGRAVPLAIIPREGEMAHYLPAENGETKVVTEFED